MNTIQEHTHTIIGVGIAVGLIALFGGAALIFLPDFIDQAFAKATEYLNLFPVK